MALVRVTTGNQTRLDKLRRAINALPISERPMWVARVAAKLRTGPAGAFAVAGGATGDWANGADPDEAPAEWDLELANWLDGVYTVVADRATEVAKGAGEAVQHAGFSLWPLAAAAVVIAIAMSLGRNAATR